MCSGAIIGDLGARFKVKSGDDIMFLPREILALAEVCAVRVSSSLDFVLVDCCLITESGTF